MKKIIIQGGNVLEGEVRISGSKNAALPIICASLLAKGTVTLLNCPEIEDLENLFSILRSLGVIVKREQETITIDASNIQDVAITHEAVSKFRASYYLMGTYLSLFQKVNIRMPGGCDLGNRPFDLHLKAFKRLNCEVQVFDDHLEIQSLRLLPAKIFFEIPSVGATINTMLASVFIEGTTTIDNAAKEPEVVDVAKFLNRMGAKITGAGTSTIVIEGVQALKGITYRIMPDRIEAGTYALMAAAMGKEVDIIHFEPIYHNALITKFIESGVRFRIYTNKLKVIASPVIGPIHIETSYFPGFPTDLQQPFTAVLTQARGVSTVIDHIYHKRFKNCIELNRLGAKIDVTHNRATIYGPTPLKGGIVRATDLRGGMSLIIAGLLAHDKTVVEQAEHIFRGYSRVIEKIRGIGGDIRLSD
ncbi:MAG TPA: UDP-N-acetylglucosamine 1-carboxyvinyltransferase [Haloplasmataceae bacterium]